MSLISYRTHLHAFTLHASAAFVCIPSLMHSVRRIHCAPHSRSLTFIHSRSAYISIFLHVLQFTAIQHSLHSMWVTFTTGCIQPLGRIQWETHSTAFFAFISILSRMHFNTLTSIYDIQLGAHSLSRTHSLQSAFLLDAFSGRRIQQHL